MKSLVGTWLKEGGDRPNFEVLFELTANNSVLVETWLRKGIKHSLTVYHLNIDTIMATHYCPQGNQPRLELSQSSTMSHLNFDFFDATNLKVPTDSHQHSLGFKFMTKNKIKRLESYMSGSGEDQSELTLVRSQ